MLSPQFIGIFEHVRADNRPATICIQCGMVLYTFFAQDGTSDGFLELLNRLGKRVNTGLAVFFTCATIAGSNNGKDLRPVTATYH